MAATRTAGADVEAEVPDPGRQRPDRQRAAAARFACAATLCDGPAGQGRVRPAPRPPRGRRASRSSTSWTGRSGRARASGSSASTAPARRRCCGCSTGELHADAGTVKRGKTLKIGYLSQALAELDGADRVLDAVEKPPADHRTGGRRGDQHVDTLLEDFGFTGDKLTARLADLSGGERRRLQFLRLLLDEPNVLLLDEPTNDLDIDTLTVIEDYLDGWPGTLIVVTHDRYFLERVSDVTYALTGGGRCDLLPGGIEQYLADRAAAAARRTRAGRTAARRSRRRRGNGGRARRWRASRVSWPSSTSRSPRCTTRWPRRPPITCGSGELNAELSELLARKESLEEAWLAAAERLSDLAPQPRAAAGRRCRARRRAAWRPGSGRCRRGRRGSSPIRRW